MKRREHSAGPVFSGVVLVVGLSVVVSVYAGLRSTQRENAERVMDQRTAVAAAAVRTETERYRSLVETTAAGFRTNDALTWEDFDTATAPLASADLIGAAYLAFVVPATQAQIPALEGVWRARGADGLRLRPVGAGEEHYFTIFTRTLNSAGRPMDGLDLAAAPEAASALTDSRRVGQPSVSDTYVLLRDRNLPAAQQQRSFVFAAPIWSQANHPEFRGWIVLGLRGQDFLSGVLATVSQGQLDGELLATGRDGARPVVAQYTVPGSPDLRRTADLVVADRGWTLITRADASHLPGASSTLPLTLLLTGCAMVVLLAGLVYVLATGRARALAGVHAATAELRAAEAESRRQAGLLGAIMASISDPVGVVDANGAFLLHNPAARAMLGVAADEDDPQAWQRHYGLYRPDGRTPFPVDEMPLIRALRGEPCDGVEMIVRNERRPEGILVSVDGRPLDPSAGQPGAVAVFHDITDLRRYENDLAVFAGVVAHDLKAPLTVIRGHCEVAREDLDEAPDEVRGSLDRIILAVDRMATLIDTLLAYTTARDAPLRTRRVDLGALVAEVVHDRTAHLRENDRPRINVGPLPAVTADPAMLRHVLDNLIGNALKYVRPGSAPHVDVTGDVTGDVPGEQWARVEVADRGIGIPDADKSDIFDSFHRAHAEAGYAGTGLGLAICKRIVDRHGGEIGVTDNPGGGTRFSFTLPASEEETTMKKTDEAAAQAALERALAERAAIENSRLPGLSALPAAEPSSHDPASARLRAPVPDHHPASPAGAE
ncbi:ATP-binding protein [Paractinoplanes abujensis]|uniref:Sensor-like histidine kinase SenX3 n=1 Tax=Paractinoplanes abujensis TaxID=882441 RepID=A0A7W7G162_9ACTN|nr:ATP-binding protein [Actinoplanes abujensis]MBB4690296.1 signal transduction histidine kinase [Actinoplanes abujensis]